MKTNFKEYLKEKQVQKVINSLAKKYTNKKFVLYGAGLFAGDLLRNYDLSKLNIIGVADIKFTAEEENDYYGYKKIVPDNLTNTDFDVLLLTVYDDCEIKKFIKKAILKGQKPKFKIKTLIRLNLFEYIKEILNGDL